LDSSGGRAGDEEKAGMLRRLVPGAAERLRLFDADLFDAATFAPAIAGCQFVFLLATPFGLEAAGNKVQYANSLPYVVVQAMIRRARRKLFSWLGRRKIKADLPKAKLDLGLGQRRNQRIPSTKYFKFGS